MENSSNNPSQFYGQPLRNGAFGNREPAGYGPRAASYETHSSSTAVPDTPYRIGSVRQSWCRECRFFHVSGPCSNSPLYTAGNTGAFSETVDDLSERRSDSVSRRDSQSPSLNSGYRTNSVTIMSITGNVTFNYAAPPKGPFGEAATQTEEIRPDHRDVGTQVDSPIGFDATPARIETEGCRGGKVDGRIIESRTFKIKDEAGMI